MTFETDGGSGTIIVGDTTLEVKDDEEFTIQLNDAGNIDGLENFDGSSVLITNDSESNATITGSDGDDFLAAGNAVNMTMTGGAGKDSFGGGVNLQHAIITDYTEGEDVIYHAQPFSNNMAIEGAVSGEDYVFASNGRTITLKDSADRVITVVDPNGDTRLYNTTADITENILEEYSEEEITTLTGGGTSSIDLAKEDYDVAIVDANASGKKNISLDGDVAIVEETNAKVSITASKGVDTIYSTGDNVTVNLNKGGNAWLFVPEGRMTIEGYDDTTGAGFNDNYSDILPEIVDKIASNEISFDKGKLTMGAAVVSFGDVTNKIVNFYNAENGAQAQKVGFVTDDAAINASSRKDNLILVGGIASTLLGGAGNDTVYADDESFIDAGAGKNQIYLEENSESTIAMRNGKSTIANFNAGFDDTSDKLFVGVNDTVDFKFDGNDLKVYNNGEMRGVLSNVGDGADFVNILAADNNSTSKIAVAQENAVITVEDEIADLYVGKKSGVDFASYDESLTIDLSKNFYGINRVTLGGGLNTLISSSANETLTGNGTTEYIFDKDSGRDVISNFNFDEDKINVGNETITAVNVNSAGGVRMQISGDGWLTLENAQGENFKINNFVAVADENLTYNDEANYFVATAQNATLTVGESAEIWLDGSHGKTFSGDIRTLDASTAAGKTSLAGNDLDNRIFAGQGDASLWGGNGGDDLLIGGAGKNTFFYTNGNGSDTIANAHDGDEVILSTVTLDQIASANITGDAVAINFTDGGSLQVNSNANVTYQLADGSQFSANHTTGTWASK